MKKIKIEISKDNLLGAIMKTPVHTLTGNYVLELDVENLQVLNEKPITPDDYYRWKTEVKKYGVNLKDLREIIMLASVWWTYGPWENEEIFIQNYLLHKSEFKEKVYSGELISVILTTLSKISDPVSYFYHRIRTKDPKEYASALDYVSDLYSLNYDTQE